MTAASIDMCVCVACAVGWGGAAALAAAWMVWPAIPKAVKDGFFAPADKKDEKK